MIAFAIMAVCILILVITAFLFVPDNVGIFAGVAAFLATCAVLSWALVYFEVI